MCSLTSDVTDSVASLFGHGKTVIKAGVILPSRVTNLIIERPPGFNFSAGDWVFVKIPSVASRYLTYHHTRAVRPRII